MQRPWTIWAILFLLVGTDLAGYFTVGGSSIPTIVGFTFLSLLMLPVYYWLYKGAKWTWTLSVFISITNCLGMIYYSSKLQTIAKLQLSVETGGSILLLAFLFLPEVRKQFSADRSDEQIQFDLARCASPSKRVLAFLVDVLVASILGSLLLFCASFFLVKGESSDNLVHTVTWLSFGIAFSTMPILTSFGGTLGQRIFNFKVVNVNGEHLSIPLSFCRFIYVVFFGVISVFVIFFDQYLRTIHDNVTRTYMITK